MSGQNDRQMSTGPGGRPNDSMTLITEMMQRPLDPGYAAAAERRQKSGLPAATGLRSPLLIIVAVLIYAAFHLGHGRANYRHRKAAGLRPNFYWSSVRGP